MYFIFKYRFSRLPLLFIHLQWRGISSSLPCFTMNTNISAWFPWTRVVMYVLHTTQGKFLPPVIRRRCSLVFMCTLESREGGRERIVSHSDLLRVQTRV
jgi:hypothetical protein